MSPRFLRPFPSFPAIVFPTRPRRLTLCRGTPAVTDGQTGVHSVFTQFQGLDIMFHVSTLLPYSGTNAQQVRPCPQCAECATSAY